MGPISQAPGPLDSHRSRAIIGVTITFTITSSVSLFLRIYAKRLQRMRLAAEDWTIIAGQVAVYGMATCAILAVVIGGDGHHAATQPEKVPTFLKILIALQVHYAVTLGLVKISICLFYDRIFPIKPFRYWCWAVMVAIAAWAIMVILTAFLLCRPFAYNWDPTIPDGKCGDQPTTFIAVGVLDLIIDVMVGVLPLPMIWGLHISTGNKMGLLAIFSVGVTTMVISVLRIHALVATDFMDITYTAAYPTVWSFAEPAIGVSVACAPLLRGLYRHKRGKNEASSGSGSALRGTKSSNVSQFKRLETDDAYPLTSVTREILTPNHLSSDEWDAERVGVMQPPSGIIVQREWRTESSKLQGYRE